jgi:GGDEF domain-containing protein
MGFSPIHPAYPPEPTWRLWAVWPILQETMISIRQSIAELEQEHRERRLVAECYAAAIQNAAEYAIELEAGITDPYRKELLELVQQISNSGMREMAESKGGLRAVFRSYRDSAAKYLTHLRSELAGTAKAFQGLLESLAEAEGDHEKHMQSALCVLREVSRSLKESPAGNLIDGAADNIERSFQQLRKQNQLTIAEFVTETRLLHTRIDQLEQAAAIDGLTNVFSRAEMEERLTANGGQFTILLVRAGNLRACAKKYSPEICAQVASAFAQRLCKGLPTRDVTGRWADEQFVSILPTSEAEALAIAKWASNYLSGSYVCRHAGKSAVPQLTVTTAILSSAPGEPGPELVKRIQQGFQKL